MHTSLPLSSPNYKHIQLITHKSRFHLCERWECKAARQEQWHTLIHKEEINISHTLASYVGTHIFTLDWWWFDFQLKEVMWGTCACTAHCVCPSLHTVERQVNIPLFVCVNKVHQTQQLRLTFDRAAERLTAVQSTCQTIAADMWWELRVSHHLDFSIALQFSCLGRTVLKGRPPLSARVCCWQSTAYYD